MGRRDAEGIARVAALDDGIRRRIFELLRRARRPLSREDVAGEIGISRKLAAFHLDKMAGRGLLESHYARPPGRSGPGAGRSAKFYEPSDMQIEIAIPDRRYASAGALLVEAIRSQGPGESAAEAAFRVAGERGGDLGRRVRHDRRLRSPGPERALSVASEVLDEEGYEPYRDSPGVVALKNCPFHELAESAPDLICQMNQAFIDGFLRGIGNDNVQSVLECKPGDCCVTLRAPAKSR